MRMDPTDQHNSYSSAICRACMTSGSSEVLVSLGASLDGDASISSVIEELIGVEMREDDGLPGQICGRCVHELRRLSAYIKKVRETDRTLREIYEGIKSEANWTRSELDEVLEQEERLELDSNLGVEEEYLEYEEDVSCKGEPPENTTEQREAESNEQHETKLEVEVNNSSEVEFIGFDHGDEQSEDRREIFYEEQEGSDMLNVDDDIQELDGDDTLDKQEQQTFKILLRKQEDFLCCACYHFFPSEEALMEHCEMHNQKTRSNLMKPHVCDICYRRYTTARALNSHREQSLTGKIYECKRCRARFINRKRRREHAHNHPQTEVIQSSVIAPIRLQPNYRKGKICCAQACGISFPTDELLIAHAHEAHRMNKFEAALPENINKPFECPVCFKRFFNKNALRQHQKRKYKKSIQQCSICGLRLPGPTALATHERMHRDEKPYPCQICDKAFASGALLKAHSVVHSTDKPFVCSVCGAGFQRKATLKNHELLHSGQLPFQCDLCPKAFRVKPRLELHMRSHTGVRPYKCRYCDKTFADHSNRQRHEMGHTGVKPYKCAQCEKTFITKRLLSEHETTHHPTSMIYTCQECPATFCHKASLNKHMSVLHVD
ncbi:gastrula zinc finger protein XlCGF26.1-like [Toxorhynchites rutilus septentrionalis]|uniref:gastrula zinc finger protein XlCGF26.1-like n=1 Tax=Toxorhynchites rutilus septentrionalis TaxID=329112 RepID=UPI0024797D36|nr:gastrula zinc finger protein XlCGF26.1-like [Toxorhynchites rutilus septentrionalis]